MKLSICIPIYNSHEVVARQVKYFEKMNLPNDVEFVFVDDGSNPPLDNDDYGLCNLTVYFTNDKRPWTQGLARNFGAKRAQGEYLFFTDIDHILSYEAIMAARQFTGHRMIFPRYFAILDQDGNLSQKEEDLFQFGLAKHRLYRSGHYLYASYHGNTLVVPKSEFWELGGYDPNHCQYGHHADVRKGEDTVFNDRWNKWATKNGFHCEVGPKVYVFPSGQYLDEGITNPGGIFHDLSYAQEQLPLKP